MITDESSVEESTVRDVSPHFLKFETNGRQIINITPE